MDTAAPLDETPQAFPARSLGPGVEIERPPADPVPEVTSGGNRLGRRLLGIGVRGTVLILLLGLTYRHASRSPALERAREAEQRGDYARAIVAAQEHLSSRPWGDEAAKVAGRSLSRLDFAGEAEPYYQRAGELTLEDRHYRAYGLVRGNRREEAIAAYLEILDQHPEDVAALQMMAGVLITQSRWSEAKQAAQRLIAIPEGPRPVYKPVMESGAWTLHRSEVPTAPVIGWTLAGIVDHDTREFEMAVSDFERVLELDPLLETAPLQRSLFWSYLIEDLVRVGRFDDVIKYLGTLPEYRDDPSFLVLLGQARYQKGDREEAERVWHRILSLDPDHLGALLGLGRLELQRSRLPEAISFLKRAADRAPDSYQAHYNLSLAYRRVDQEDLARTHQQLADAIRSRSGSAPSDDGPPVGTAPAPASGRD